MFHAVGRALLVAHLWNELKSIVMFRLQPSAIVTDEDCAACLFNKPGKGCLRKMEWVWRGETFAATTAEYYSLKNQLASEPLPTPGGGPPRAYDQLPHEERARLLKDRLKKYCQKVTVPPARTCSPWGTTGCQGILTF